MKKLSPTICAQRTCSNIDPSVVFIYLLLCNLQYEVEEYSQVVSGNKSKVIPRAESIYIFFTRLIYNSRDLHDSGFYCKAVKYILSRSYEI